MNKMFNPESGSNQENANWHPLENSAEGSSIEQAEKVKQKEVRVFDEDAPSGKVLGNVKQIGEAFAPHLDEDVEIRFRKTMKEERGTNARLIKKFREEGYADSVALNPNKPSQEIYSTLLHELGHSLEEKILDLAKQNGTEVLPPGEEEYPDLQADLVACYVREPELLERYDDVPLVKATIEVLREALGGNDFEDLREQLKEEADQQSDEEVGDPKFYHRLFDSIEAYMKLKN